MKIISEKEIYNNMRNTYLANLPYELLEMILDITAFKNHNILQYQINKDIIMNYINKKVSNNYLTHYIYNINDDLLLVEMNYI